MPHSPTTRTLLCLAASLCLSVASRADTTLYSQSPVMPLNGAGGWTSATVNFNQGFATYDDFVLPSDSTITRFTWQGAYVGTSVPNSTGWFLLIDPSVTIGGIPFPTAAGRSVFFSNTVSSVFVGTTNSFGGTANVFRFSTSIPSFAALGGVRYWFSPIAVQPDSGSAFVWMNGAGGTSGFSASQQYRWIGGGDSFVGTRDDLAFTVQGATAPEPGTLLLILPMSLGALAHHARPKLRVRR